MKLVTIYFELIVDLIELVTMNDLVGYLTVSWAIVQKQRVKICRNYWNRLPQ